MNIEKEIKRQARKALHGNLSRLLAAAGVAALLLLVLEFGQYLVAYFTGAADLNTGTANEDNPIGFLLLMILKDSRLFFRWMRVNRIAKQTPNATGRLYNCASAL